MREEGGLEASASLGAVGGAAFIVMGGFVGSRLAGLARDVVISKVFGTSPELDAYFAAFRLPDLVFQLLAGAALGSAFIPTFSSYLARGESEPAWRLASSILNIIAGLTLVLALAGIALAPQLVPLIVPGFTAETQGLAVMLTRIMLLSPMFFSVSGIVMGILQARRRFLLPALAPIAYNLAIIAGALLLSESLGVGGLALGVAAGAALHLAIQVPGLLRAGLVYRLRFELGHPGVREVGRLMLPRVVGLAAVQVNFLVTTILASTLAPGSLAALSYAWLLLMMPLGVFGMAISTALFPTLAEQAALERLDWLRGTISAALGLILFLTLPASVGLILLREPLVALVFQRGLFDAASTQATAWALLFYSPGLAAHAALEMVSRGFYALHDTKTPVLLALVAMALNLALALGLMGPLGHGGLALAVSLSTVVEAGVLLVLLQRRLGGIGGERLIGSLLRIGVALLALAAVLALWLSFGDFGLDPARSPWVVVGGGMALSGLAYLGTAALFRSQELALLRRGLGALRISRA